MSFVAAAVFTIGAYFLILGKTIYGALITFSSVIVITGVLIKIIPQAHRITFDERCLTLYSFKICRSFHWKEIVDVTLENSNDPNLDHTEQIVLKMNNGLLKSEDSPGDQTFDVRLNPVAYGFNGQDLKNKIKNYLIYRDRNGHH